MIGYSLRGKNSQCRNTRVFSFINRISLVLKFFRAFRDFLENIKLTIQQPSHPTKLRLK
jgi:hypothetical protein